MQAYLNDPQLKEDFLKQIRNHQEQDRIVQGTYGKEQSDDFKGCAVGCSIHSLNAIKGKHIDTSSHAAYETELGIPRAIAHMEDRIFEGLEVEKAKQWPLRFSTAINVGADLSLVIPKLLLWILSDEKSGVLQYAKTERTKKAIQTVIDLYTRKLAGETIPDKEWRDARAAADAAADAAAYAAFAAYAADAAAYAAFAAYAAAYAAADAAADAAAFAAAAYAAFAADAARRKRFSEIADKLIKLLEEAK
jgi:hypothetical protein